MFHAGRTDPAAAMELQQKLLQRDSEALEREKKISDLEDENKALRELLKPYMEEQLKATDAQIARIEKMAQVLAAEEQGPWDFLEEYMRKGYRDRAIKLLKIANEED